MPKISIEEKLNLVKERLNSLDREPSEEQLDFILHPLNEPCYLKACPGSGKTEVVGIKAAYEISEWKGYFCGIAVISFTKNASKEIAARVKKYGGVNAVQHPHFIGTIDSWLHGYILHPHSHSICQFAGVSNNSKLRNRIKGDKSFKVLDNSTDADFLKNQNYHLNYRVEIKDNKGNVLVYPDGKPKTKDAPFYVTEYFLSHEDKPLSNTIREAIPHKLREQDLIDKKNNFNRDGFCTYQDAEYLCLKLLKKNQGILNLLAKRFPYIIIDECQDLSQNQLRLFHLLIEKGVKILLVGDINQAIYEFRRVDTVKLSSFISYHKLAEKKLTSNYRSNQKIVDVCVGLEKYNTGVEPQNIIGNESVLINKSCILWEYEKNEMSKIPQKFIDFINSQNVNIKEVERKISIRKSAILSRAHSTLSEFRSHPKERLDKIEMFATGLLCWTNNPRTGKDMQNALQLIGKSISLLAYNGNGKHQHQNCPDDYSPMEWRNQLSDLILKVSTASNGVYPFTDLSWTEWTSKLKAFLANYWTNFRSPINDWDSVKTKIISPSGKAKKQVLDTTKENTNSYSEKIRMTTFHDVKGETLDAVLIVSAKDKKSKGGHFEQWLSEEPDEKEFVRFAYVASSRPKHLIIWAIPKVKNNQFISKIKALGFDTI